MEDEIKVNGTLIWYYMICKREVWMMARQITADQDDDNMGIGRYLHEHRYNREKKEIEVGNGKMDFVQRKDGHLIVSEMKKSSHFIQSATMQLLYYLNEMSKRGIDAVGEIRIPLEKKVIPVELSDEKRRELEKVTSAIVTIIQSEKIPKAEQCNYCKECAYGEFCWS